MEALGVLPPPVATAAAGIEHWPTIVGSIVLAAPWSSSGHSLLGHRMALVLPLRDGAVRFEPHQTTLDSILRVLRNENAPIASWLHAAQHLLATGATADYAALLEEAIARPQEHVFSHVQALCSLAELTAQQASAERDRRQRQILLSKSTELCLQAQRLSFDEQLPELVLGSLAVIKVRRVWLVWWVSSIN